MTNKITRLFNQKKRKRFLCYILGYKNKEKRRNKRIKIVFYKFLAIFFVYIIFLCTFAKNKKANNT